MKKIIEKFYCDDCHKEAKITRYCLIDLCTKCLNERLEHSFSMVKLGRKCRTCNGTGKVKNWDYSDFEWITCKEYNCENGITKLI